MALTETVSEMSIDIECSEAIKEFKEFIKFVQIVPESIKCELTNFLYPFYVYIYMTFLKHKRITEGQQFLSSYLPLFSTSGYANVIKTLQSFKDLCDFKDHEYFRQFCESKYNIDLTDESIHKMKSFFEETESRALLSIFYLHIYITKKDMQNFPANILWNPNHSFKKFEPNSESQILKFKSVLKLLKENLNKPISYTFKILSGKKNLCSVDINFNNTQLACGFEETSEIHLWDLISDISRSEVNDKEIHFADNKVEDFSDTIFNAEIVSNPSSNKILRGHDGSVFGLSTTPNNNLLVSCSEDGTARAWSTTDLKTVAIYSGHYHPVWDIAVSPNSAYFATASKDARLWSFEDHLPLRIFLGHTGDIDCIIFHPNSKYIATSSTDKTIRLWTMEDARHVRTFSGHKSFISSLVFSPNGKHLTSADATGLVKIWELSSGLELKEYKPHSRRITSMSYNINGTLLATGSLDNYLKVWDVRSVGDKNFPTSLDMNMQKEGFPKLVDSHLLDSAFHFVKFCKRGRLVSVISSLNNNS